MSAERKLCTGVEVGVDGPCERCGDLTKNIDEFQHYFCPRCQREQGRDKPQ